jgi:glutamate N-acetyltransferase/amino-acid N-acetyltransferase
VSTGVTYASGFLAAGIAAGVKPSGAFDVALLVGDAGTTAAGLFTTNGVAAASVVCRGSTWRPAAAGASS